VKLLRATVLFAVATVALTWPLAARTHVMEPGDSAFFAWAIAWEIHALKTDPSSLPHGNIYHPATHTLGMDEPVMGTMLLALPVSLLTDDAVVLFNLARLLTYLVSALGAYLLARQLGVSEPAALLAGALFAFSPIRTDKIAHLNTLGSQWLPFCVLFVLRFARDGRAVQALLAGLFFVLTAYACGYYGMIGLLVLPVAALPLVWGRWGRLRAALPAIVLAGLALLPLRWLHAEAFGPESFSRTRDDAVFYAASIESFLATSSDNRIYGELTSGFRTAGSNNLFPGVLPIALPLLGAAGLWRARRWPRREAIALVAMAGAAVLVALGPEIRLLGNTLLPGPYAAVRAALPMFEGIRVTSRAGIYLALPLAMLTGLALNRLPLRPLAFAFVAVAALAEGLVVPIGSWTPVIDTRHEPPPVYRWLAEQPGEFAMLELPLIPADGKFSRPAFDETIYMVRSTLHWKRLVNGNAGVEPTHYRRIRELAPRFPSRELIEALRELDVRYIVVHHAGLGPNKRARLERDLPALLDAGELSLAARFEQSMVLEVPLASGAAREEPS
jgi:hypothetical protein